MVKRDVIGLLVGALACTGAACSKDKAQEAAHTTSQAAVAPEPAPAPAKKAEAELAETVKDNTFKLSLLSDPKYAAGTAQKAQLVLEALGGYHVNQDYPLHIALKAPEAVKLEKGELEKGDAKTFGESEARFELGFTAAKGAHQLLADVDFAVCTEETCVPDERTVAVVLNVE